MLFASYVYKHKTEKKTYTFLKVLPTFPRAPTNFATYLPWAKKIVWQERTLTTSMQRNLSTDD